MARGRASGSSRGSPAPRRSPPPPQQQQRRAPPPPPPAQAHATPAPMAPQQGGGMFGGIGSSIATGMSIGAGSAMGHMAINSLFGGGGGHSQPAPQQQPMPMEQNMQSQQSQQNPCMQYDQSFHQCLETNNADMGICKMAYDELSMCKRQYGL